MSAIYSDLDARIGTRIRLARHQSGRTVADLASEAGLTQAEFTDLEAGRIRPSADVIVRLAQLFGLEIRWFFGLPAAGSNQTQKSETSATLSQMRGNLALTRLMRRHKDSRPRPTKAA
ncbi:MAG: helix-turn-helix domain-containing protein [Henriciella sp.]